MSASLSGLVERSPDASPVDPAEPPARPAADTGSCASAGQTGLLLFEPARARAGAVPWILDSLGKRTPGHDDGRRLREVRAGLLGHARVQALAAGTSAQEIGHVVQLLHEPRYLRALTQAKGRDPVLIADLAQPGVEPDTPVCAEAVASAHEAIGVAIAAARQIVAGARYAYALCRPPGHHAGPGWLGGYCYLNNAAAAAITLRDGGFAQVGILDLDLHYPNGTAAIVERIPELTLHSLHGATGANLPWDRVHPRSEREHHTAFRRQPAPTVYIEALSSSVRALVREVEAIVLSLGYDLVAGDPHGSWCYDASVFAQIGRSVAASGLPVCVVQEGGYALGSLAACSRAFAAGLLDGRQAP